MLGRINSIAMYLSWRQRCNAKKKEKEEKKEKKEKG